MQIQVAAKLNDGLYDGCIFVDNKFERSSSGEPDLAIAVNELTDRYLGVKYPEGTDIAITIAIVTPEEAAKHAEELAEAMRRERLRRGIK